MTEAEAEVAWGEAVVFAGRIMRAISDQPPHPIDTADAGGLAERVLALHQLLAVHQFHVEHPPEVDGE